MKNLKLILLLVFIASHSYAQTLESKIDSIGNTVVSQSTNKGLAISIIQGDEISSYYFGNKFSDESVDEKTLFEIGSVSKLYTAYLTIKLEEEGLLKRGDLLSKYLPEEIWKDKPWSDKITLIDLATHRSGLPAYDNTAVLEQFKKFEADDPFGIFNNEFILERLAAIDDIPDYGKQVYSNFGMALLGLVLKSQSGLSFQQLIDKYLTDVSRTTFVNVPNIQLVNLAIPHSEGKAISFINLAAMESVGGIKTNLESLTSFVNMHLSPKDADRKTIDEVLKDYLPEQEEKAGFGWGFFELEGKPVRFHNGGTYGSSSVVIFQPEHRLGVVVLGNSIETNATGLGVNLMNQLIQALNE